MARPIQRIGLSATQRPLDEVARFLGGVDIAPSAARDRDRDGTSRGRRPASGTRPWCAPSWPRPIDPRGLRTARSPSSTPATARRSTCASRCRSRTWPPGRAGRRAQRPGGAGAGARLIWPAIHPRLLELVRAHRSTLIFVNSRRLAERLAAALNELAGEELARAHHGSLAREQRAEIEDGSRRATCRRWSRPRRWSWASTWAPSIW